MICIDFVGGSHGHYLEYVCNKFLGNVKTKSDPFDNDGASHNKQYLDPQKFFARHYHHDYLGRRSTPSQGKIISIKYTEQDLLPLSSICWLRAGNFNFNNDFLEINTYNKLNNPFHRWVLDCIIDNFFVKQIKQSYDAVKDPNWPEVNDINDFARLPDWIQQECKDIHNIQLLELTPEKPDCPRNILREFFKLGFRKPAQHGLMMIQEKMWYSVNNDVIEFPYSSFYSQDRFIEQINRLEAWCNMPVTDLPGLIELHERFLIHQPYKHSKVFCDQLLSDILDHKKFDLPRLDLMQESYLSAHLELHYGKEIPADRLDWFSTSEEIINYFEL